MGMLRMLRFLPCARRPKRNFSVLKNFYAIKRILPKRREKLKEIEDMQKVSVSTVAAYL